MSDSHFWQRKIQAFLHDPVFKCFDVPGHERLASECISTLLPQNVLPSGDSDWEASSMDRIPIPYERKGSGERVIVSGKDLHDFLHPLSGEKLGVFPIVRECYDEQTLKAQIEALKSWLSDVKSQYGEDYQKLFHHLWWALPSKVKMADFLPADTRFPFHSIVDHLDMTSALEACREGGKIRPVFLAVAIGPVQKFIASARTTRDLWIGSTLLSTITFQGIQVLGEQLGFDQFIFPNLRNQFLLKRWLRAQGVEVQDSDNDLPKDIASLPNRFLCLVPESMVPEMESKVRETILSKWHQVADFTLHQLGELSEQQREYWQMQVDSFPEFYCATHPWEEKDQLAQTLEHFLGKQTGFSEHLKALEHVEKNGGYKINPGTLYGWQYEVTRRKLESIKSTTAFSGYLDERPVQGDILSGEMKAIIKEYQEPGKDRIEALGALSLVKRKAAKWLDQQVEPGISAKKILSTSHLAASNLPVERRAKYFQRIENDEVLELPTPYFAVLVMDGDRMGKWVSGENAPGLENRFHPQAWERLKDFFQKQGDCEKEWKSAGITPAYHRAVSRTLDHFSSFVKPIVEKMFDGLLIYAGGDDVLAFLPASKVFSCANTLRKVYSGIGNVEIQRGERKYRFENELCMCDSLPLFPMMGEKATMSAGIAIVNHKFPLSQALALARGAEKRAKNDLERNAFSISLVRHSGQESRLGGKWELEHSHLDLLEQSQALYETLKGNKVSRKALDALLDEKLVKEFSPEEFCDKYVPYIFAKRGGGASQDRLTEVGNQFSRTLNLLFPLQAEKDRWEQVIHFIQLVQAWEFVNREGSK